jgi:AcrR family transcriptional regulator
MRSTTRPTFYDYFAGRDECFAAALADVQERLAGEIREAIRTHEPQRALEATVGALVGFASAEPAMARFLMSESTASGSRALDARDQGIGEIEQMIEQAHGQVHPNMAIPDVSPRVVIGGTYRLLAARLRRGEPALSALREDLLSWIRSYETAAGEGRWRGLEPGPAPAPSSFLPETVRSPPAALGPGRPRLSPEEVAGNHRQRILFAAADLAEQKGSTATTIADITKLAGIDGRAFYSAFDTKQDTFMAVHELGFQEVMAVTAGAFFAGTSWPERSWEAGRAFTQFLEQNPTIAHVGFVEAYAVGPGAVQRVEDSHTAFTMFLQEGYQYAPDPDPPAVSCSRRSSRRSLRSCTGRRGPAARWNSRGCWGTLRFCGSRRLSGWRRRTRSLMGRWRRRRSVSVVRRGRGPSQAPGGRMGCMRPQGACGGALG